jgi:hypothetical protein
MAAISLISPADTPSVAYLYYDDRLKIIPLVGIKFKNNPFI